MAEGSRNVFRGNLEKGVEKQRGCCPVREDRKTVAGWIRKTREEAESEEERCGQNEYLRNNRQQRYVDVPDRELSAESFDRRPICTKDLHASLGPSEFRGACPRKDVLAKLAPTTDTAAINEVIQQVENDEITTAAEFIFGLTPYVRDKAVLFREILEKELNYFREIVNDTVDRRVQDEADVMMHTQKRIKNKFKSRSHEMTQRTMRIRQRLHEISAKFNWAVDGRDKEKIAKLVDTPKPNKNINEKENKSDSIDKLTHRVFMRGQWLKKELTRLQDENNNLKRFLCKFRKLAAERKKQESYVPEMLSREKKELERELNELRKTYKTNLEIINALYIEHHRCIKPPSEHSVVD